MIPGTEYYQEVAHFMNCPYCECEDLKVLDSRPAEESNSIRRRRECAECKKRFTTYEKIDIIPIMVIKKDGRRELFSGEKLLTGIMRAFQKRPVSVQEMEKIVGEVETTLDNLLQREVKSEYIGELVMDKLKQIDDVAYVRYASVTRQFKDINTFMEELSKLLKEKK
jgi:transcriptional repressor NrdR